LTKRKGTGNFEQWQNVGKYYLRVSAPKTQCQGATSAPCTCELQRKPLPSRKRNRRSEAAAISVTLANQNPYLIRRRQVLYAFTEASANNGSAFAGLSANTPFYNITLGLVMLFGRFLMKVPALALAGSLAAKKSAPPSAGTFPTDGVIFVILLLGVILIVAALTFFPADALGPIVEHLAMRAGKLY
jgi:hypothetical protein